jgi:DNA-binding CsgD family transcriptional regulator
MAEDSRPNSVLVIDPHGLLADGPVRRLNRAAGLQVRTMRSVQRAMGALSEQPGPPCAVVVAALLEPTAAARTLDLLDLPSPPHVPAHVIAALKRRPRNGPLKVPLTARERQVLSLLANGHTNRETAAALGVSERTIETHRAHLVAKLGTRTRAELVLAGRRLELDER